MSDKTWLLVLTQTKLDEQWEVLVRRTDMTERERAMALARFAEANVYVPFTRAMEALEKKYASDPDS